MRVHCVFVNTVKIDKLIITIMCIFTQTLFYQLYSGGWMANGKQLQEKLHLLEVLVDTALLAITFKILGNRLKS